MKQLWLNKEIYSGGTIRNAIKAYSGYAAFSVIEDNTYICLQFDKCKYDELRTVKEFENYLIGLENI